MLNMSISLCISELLADHVEYVNLALSLTELLANQVVLLPLKVTYARERNQLATVSS